MKNIVDKLKYKINKILLATFLVLTILGFSFIWYDFDNNTSIHNKRNSKSFSFNLNDVPEFAGGPYVLINDNVPYFSEDDYTLEPFEIYSDLDSLGRCGVAYANICKELMPVDEREEIGMIKPSGWQTVKYDIVDGKYLYNRCHLIGFQLSGENANIKNLITGTRFMNTEGMLPFENIIDGYVDKTGNHVLYRVTPIFEGNNLIAKGVQLEAWSIEDEGKGVCFNVFVYNNQPGIKIDYSNGVSEHDEEYEKIIKEAQTEKGKEKYIINTNTNKFHYESCKSVKDIYENNKLIFYGYKNEVEIQGFESCGICKP